MLPHRSLILSALLAAALALLASSVAAAFPYSEPSFGAGVAADGGAPCCGRPPAFPVKPLVASPPMTRAHFGPSLAAPPAEWDWRDHAPLVDHLSQRSAVTWCGACFAAATAVAISDRFRIAHRRRFGQRRLSTQALLNCGGPVGAGNCNGGSWEMLYDLISRKGVTDDTCMPYMGLDRSVTPQLPCWDTMCRECTLDGSCRLIPNPPKYYVSSWGSVAGEKDMVEELYNRGPLTCYIYTHLPEFSTYKGGVIPHVPVTPAGNITHVVEVIGYGVDAETKTPYWTARNWSGTPLFSSQFILILAILFE